MSKSNFPPRTDGHLITMSHNRDLEQKLTYQQLLNLNHDLTKENQQLKNICTFSL
jgi:tryptophan synthase alpha subunit